MTSVDRILELIDAGLGDSTELTYTDDNRKACWRCQDRAASSLMDGACSECAAWLLGEGEDPLFDASLLVSGPYPSASPIALERLRLGAAPAYDETYDEFYRRVSSAIRECGGTVRPGYAVWSGPTIDHGDGIYSSSSGIWRT